MTQRYKAPPSGGLFNTGIQPRQAPDFGGLADSLVNAFALTRESIVRRALMQQQAEQQRQQNDRVNAQFELEKQRFTLAQQQAERESANAVIQAHANGYSPVDPNEAPTTAAGMPQPEITIGNMRLRYDPSKSPEERKKAERNTKRANLIAAGIPEKQVEAVLDNPSLADNILFPRPDVEGRQKRMRDYMIANPLPSRARGAKSEKPASFKGVTSGSSSSAARLKAPGAAPAVSDIDRALDMFDGDVEKATEYLRKQGHK